MKEGTLTVESYRRNVVSNAAANALGNVTQFALVVVLAHHLKIMGFATYVAAAALVGMGEMFSDFGVRIWAQRQFAIGENLAASLQLAIVTKAVNSLFWGTVLIAIPWGEMTFLQTSLAVCIAITQPSTDPLLWLLRGRERLDLEAAILFGWRITTACMLATVAWLRGTADSILVIWLLLNLLRIGIESRFALIWSVVHGLFRTSAITRTMVWTTLVSTAPIGISFALMSLYNRLGVFLIGRTGTPTDVALFGAIFTLVASAGFVGTSITVAGFPRLSRAIEAGRMDESGDIVRQKLTLIGLVFFPACLLGMFVGPGVIRIVYPAQYFRASEAIPLLLAALFISIINFALKFALNALRRNWWDAVSAMLGIVAFAAIYLSTSWRFPPYGAALGWCIGEMVVFLCKSLVLWSDGRISLQVLPLAFTAFLVLAAAAYFSADPIFYFYQHHFL